MRKSLCKKGSNLPCGHEGQHNHSASNSRVVLVAILASIPLCQAEDFHHENGKEEEQDNPQSQQTDNDRQTSARMKVQLSFS
jgi:hypothetical protein